MKSAVAEDGKRRKSRKQNVLPLRRAALESPAGEGPKNSVAAANTATIAASATRKGPSASEKLRRCSGSGSSRSVGSSKSGSASPLSKTAIKKKTACATIKTSSDCDDESLVATARLPNESICGSGNMAAKSA